MIFLTGDAFNFLRTKEEEEELCVQDLKNTRVGMVRVGSECRAVFGHTKTDIHCYRPPTAGHSPRRSRQIIKADTK